MTVILLSQIYLPDWVFVGRQPQGSLQWWRRKRLPDGIIAEIVRSGTLELHKGAFSDCDFGLG